MGRKKGEEENCTRKKDEKTRKKDQSEEKLMRNDVLTMNGENPKPKRTRIDGVQEKNKTNASVRRMNDAKPRIVETEAVVEILMSVNKRIEIEKSAVALTRLHKSCRDDPIKLMTLPGRDLEQVQEEEVWSRAHQQLRWQRCLEVDLVGSDSNGSRCCPASGQSVFYEAVSTTHLGCSCSLRYV